MVTKPPCNAGDAGSTASSGTSHVLWVNQARVPPRLSLPTWSTRATAPEACAVQRGEPRSEKPEHHGSEALAHHSWRKPGPSNKDPAQPINKFQRDLFKKKKKTKPSLEPKLLSVGAKSFPGCGDVLFLFDESSQTQLWTVPTSPSLGGRWASRVSTERACVMSAQPGMRRPRRPVEFLGGERRLRLLLLHLCTNRAIVLFSEKSC